MAQGIPWGFVAITLAALLGSRGLSTAEVGSMLALSTLPWTFKWVWGPLIDRFAYEPMGRRRPWILVAQLCMALTIGAMIALPDPTSSLSLLGWMVFAHNCFNSLQDVAVDALAVDLLREEERGFANGLMYGSKYLGGAIGGAGMGWVVATSGFRAALVLQVGALLLIMLFPLLLRERPGERLLPWTRGESQVPATLRKPKDVRGLFADLARAFRLRATLSGAVLALLATAGAGIVGTVAAVLFMQRLHWDPAYYTAITGGPALILGLGGSVAGGWLADRVGHRRMIVLATLALSGSWLVFAALEPYWSNDAVPIAVMLAEALFQSMLSASLFALFMDISWPKVAATQFTAYMALLNLSTVLGQKLAGPLDSVLSFPGLYVAAAVIQAAAIVPALLIDPHQTRRVLGA